MRQLHVPAIMLAACFPLLASCGGEKNHPGDAGDDEADAVDDNDGDGVDADSTDSTGEEEADAGDSSDCPEGYAFNPYLSTPQCVECTRACGLEGETGDPWEVTAVSGECVCITIDGYYFSLSGAGVSHRCDKDQDGWVTRSARSNIESTDPAIAANARCDLRVVDRFVLLAEDEAVGDGCTVTLSDTDLGVDSIALYEADNRDDQVLLDEDTYAPAYGARKLRAEELNSLTKGCVSLIGDFNSSGDADVNEWDLFGDPLYAFAYFLELHRGWYEDGAYYVQEKSRLADAEEGWGVPLVYNDDGYWRECVRMTDSEFDPIGVNAIGMDFARYNDGAEIDAGMHHHSQYKCVHLVETNTDPEAYPQRLPMEELNAVPRRYVLNACEAGDTSAGPVSGTVNPWDALLTCEIDTSPSVDDVGFVAVKYMHYDTATGSYVRGCVNGCVDSPPDCPPAASCAPDVNDYGRPECVCPNHWTGVDCDVCPEHWDPTPSSPTDLGCSECLNNYDPATDCTACLAHYDVASDCTVCHPRWQTSSGCTTCINNYDVATDCSDCLYHYDLLTACTACELHFDPFTVCSTCLWNWNVATDCSTCTAGFTTSSDCRRTGNLLQNPGAEAGSTTSWSATGYTMTATGAATCTNPSAPYAGSYRFMCCNGSSSECRLYQDIPYSVLSAYEAGIDAGRYTLEVDSYLQGLWGSAGFWIVFYDITYAPIVTTSWRGTSSDAWTRVTDSRAIPAGTKIIRIYLDTNDEWGITDCSFDDLALYIVE